MQPCLPTEQVVGHVDRRHPAFAQLTLDGVAALQGCVQAGDWIGHGRTPGSAVVNI